MTDGQIAAVAAFAAALITGMATIAAGYIQSRSRSETSLAETNEGKPKHVLRSTMIVIYVTMLIFFTVTYSYGRFVENENVEMLGHDGLLYGGVVGLALLAMLSEWL